VRKRSAQAELDQKTATLYKELNKDSSTSTTEKCKIFFEEFLEGTGERKDVEPGRPV
jgi:hypothetical protein